MNTSYSNLFFKENCTGLSELFFSRMFPRAGFTSPARPRGAGEATRETDSIFSTLRARRAGHAARAWARLATGGSPVDSPPAEASGVEICLARPSRKRPAGRKKQNYTVLYNHTVLYLPRTYEYVHTK